MASDIAAQPQTHLPQYDSMDTGSQEASFEAPIVNGDHAPISDTILPEESNIQDAPADAPPMPMETVLDTKVTAATASDAIPAGPTPIDDISTGIQPIADFLPKDASNLSHPTPPPEEPFTSGSADVDMQSEDVETAPQLPAEPEPVLAPAEPSLVRPREDDGEDEPVAKRSRVEDVASVGMDATSGDVEDAVEESVDVPMADESGDTVVAPVGELSMDQSAEAVVELIAEPKTEPSDEPADEPSSMAVEVGMTQPLTDSLDAPAESLPSAEATAPVTEPSTEDKPVDTSVTTEAQPPTDAATATATTSTYSTAPMTSMQKTALVEKMKNLKKTKNSVAFLKPVDPIALNIPSYTEIIKSPMDLGTMESKLKEGKYGSVQDFVNDFDLIISNVRRFNGDQHNITQAGFAMQAYFNRMMEAVPPADMVEPPKVQKRRSPSIPREQKPRRESRAAVVPAPAPTGPPAETYALQPDGTPQIRRQSSNRPARAIKPPQNREIPYAKPKRKEHQLELRFCEKVLDEIRSTKHGQINHVFQTPVDPVALNIPHYRQVIKNPMDLGTMSQKLRGGQYGTAAEFKKDFDLMIKNCVTFNPINNPVRDMGIQLQREFESLWQNKDKWERKNQPASNRASSASADDESGADEEDEEEDDEDDKTATIRALQKQLADMQNALSGMTAEKSKSSKKAKASKSSSKKIGSVSSVPAKSKAPAKPASKPKKARQVTYEEKQEISEAVAKMDDKQVGKLTEIITQNCAKYRDMEEMELEIDDLPNDVQVMLLDFVRRQFGNPHKKKVRDPSPDDAAALDDDDFEPERGARGGKRKKHRPMGKTEQQDAINNLKSKLAQFSQAATSGSESPTNSSFNVANAQAETSGDEESEESEEE